LEVAFWVNLSGESRWYLYAASEKITDSTIGQAYRDVLRLTGEVADPFLDPFEVKLIAANDPLARAVREVRNRFPAALKRLYRDCQLGGMSIEGAFIYPPNIMVSSP
jgi:hypothetical protein